MKIQVRSTLVLNYTGEAEAVFEKNGVYWSVLECTGANVFVECCLKTCGSYML